MSETSRGGRAWRRSSSRQSKLSTRFISLPRSHGADLGLRRISESAGQISQLSTETAQGAEEAVEALKNLATLANDLDSMIQQFRLDEGRQPGGTCDGREAHFWGC